MEQNKGFFKVGSIRQGKTKRDHKSGAWARNQDNKNERADWRQQSEKTRSQANFPWHTCNGKKNRSLDNHHNPITIIPGMK